MRGATEPGVMPGDGSWKESLEPPHLRNVGMRAWRVGDLEVLVATFEKRWHENLEGRICFVSDLGLVATHFCDKT